MSFKVNNPTEFSPIIVSGDSETPQPSVVLPTQGGHNYMDCAQAIELLRKRLAESEMEVAYLKRELEWARGHISSITAEVEKTRLEVRTLDREVSDDMERYSSLKRKIIATTQELTGTGKRSRAQDT